MKIAMLNTLYYPYRIGGAEVSVQLLAESLADAGHGVSVITLHDAQQRTVEQLNGVTLYRLPLRNLYWPFSPTRNSLLRLSWHLLDIYNPLARADVRDLLEQIQPDVLHTNNLAGFSVAVWDAARALGIAVVHTSRDYYLIHPNCTLYDGKHNQHPASLSCRLFSLVKKWRSQHVERYVAISDHVGRLHKELGYFPLAPAEVIYNSIAQPDQPPRADATEAVITLGYLGRIEPSKGIEVALQVCRRLGPGYRLQIAGTGQPAYMAQLQAANGDLPLTWLGHVPPAQFFPGIDILLVPSQWAEPLGRVVLEAASYGVPVVGSDRGGIPEIINQGQTGYACPPDDADAFADAVGKLARQDRQEVATQCTTWAEQFSRQSITQHYLRTFEQLAQRHELSNTRSPTTPLA